MQSTNLPRMQTIVEVTKEGAVSVIGGGDTATACKVYDTVDKVPGLVGEDLVGEATVENIYTVSDRQ